MTPVEEIVERPPRGSRAPRGSHGRAFGIHVEANFQIPELPPGARAGDWPRTRLESAELENLRRAWPGDGALRLVDRRFTDGRQMMVVEHDEEAGYLVSAPQYGLHVVDGDGSRVSCALPAGPAWRWERLLFAQVLPLAAALAGRTLFHASAVAIGGAVLAFTGPVRAGKSSVAAHLVAGGAELVTDDVLALEANGHDVLAFPGIGMIAVDPRELASMSRSGRDRLGDRLGGSEKAYLAAPVADDPGVLCGVYFLARGGRGSITIEQVAAEPSRLLGSGFITYLRSPRQLVRHLEVCARVADTVPAFDVSAAASAAATDVAAAVEAHARDVLGGR
jgi:hypothetical protein